MRATAALCAISLFVAGCATRADNINASYISPVAYEGYTCPQLREEAARVSAKASAAIGEQNGKATNDAVMTTVGVVVFFPTLFFVKGDGASAAEVGRLKGEMEAIDVEKIQKKCGLQFKPATS